MAADVLAPNQVASQGLPAACDAIVFNRIQQIVHEQERWFLWRILFCLPPHPQAHFWRPICLGVQYLTWVSRTDGKALAGRKPTGDEDESMAHHGPSAPRIAGTLLQPPAFGARQRLVRIKRLGPL